MRQRFLPFFLGFKHILSKYAILLVLLLAAMIRLIGVDQGLPYLYIPDEAHFTDPAFRIITEGELNPYWFGHPGSFVIYFLAVYWLALIGVYQIYSLFTGQAHTFAEVKATIVNIPQSDPTMFYLSGRILMIVFAVLTVYAVYKLGKKYLNGTIGLLAAFLLAVTPIHIEYSRHIRTDIAATMLIMFSLIFLLNFIDNNRKKKWLILSSLFAGFSIASKYPSAIVVFPILLYCFVCDIKAYKFSTGLAIQSKRNNAKNTRPFANSLFLHDLLDFIKIRTCLSRAILFIFVGFFISAPFVILDFSTARKDLSIEFERDYIFAQGVPGFHNYNLYLNDILNVQMFGPVSTFFIVLGLVWVMARKHKERKFWVLFLFPVLYFLVIGLLRFWWARWMIPVLPFVALLFSIGIFALYKGITHNKFLERAKPVLILLFAVLLVKLSYPTIVGDFTDANILTRVDRRTIAKEWIEKNLPAGSIILYEAEGPPLDIRPKKPFILVNRGFKKIVSRPIRVYERKGVNYIVINSFHKRHVLRKQNMYPTEASRYDYIKENMRLIKVFDQEGHPGLVFELYEVKDRAK